MAKKLTSILGIDIGSQKIKVCEIKTQGREPVITALGIIDTPEGAVDHTGVYNSDAVGDAIKKVLAESGASSPFAVVSIAGQASVLVRTLEVPKMNPTELKDHMQWEINRNIPFAESTIVSDFKPLGGDDPASPNMDVVMAIAPQSAIDTIISCVKRAGRTTSAIDVEPLSIARSIHQSYEDVLADKTICLVEMGAKTTSINIYKGTKLLMPRQVPVGGELFTKAIADALVISVDEAEQIKQTTLEIPENAATFQAAADPFGSGVTTQEFQPYNPFSDDPAPAYTPVSSDLPMDPLGDPLVDSTDPLAVPSASLASTGPDSEALRLYNAIAPVLDEFVSEIRRSVDYFRSRGGEVDQLLLTGGGTKIKGLSSFLGKALSISCDTFDPMRRLNLNAKKVADGFVEDHKSEFAIAVGNGLHIFTD